MTLFVLDTDHLSLYQRNAEPLLSKLLSHPADELAITIVTVEEQLRGRLAQIRKATTAAHLNECYRWLGETVDQLARLQYSISTIRPQRFTRHYSRRRFASAHKTFGSRPLSLVKMLFY